MKRFLFLEDDQEQPIGLEVDAADLWVHSRRSPDKTTPNQDAAAVWSLSDGSFVLAVADGLGGAPGGTRAAACAIEALDRAVSDLDDASDLREPILDAFETANQEILALSMGAGTTLVVVELRDRRLRSYHVGDSAALVVGQRGKLKLETIAHSPVGYGVAAGFIDPDAALDRDDRHYITNHLGSTEMHIQVGSPIVLAARDTVLVASDGLLDNLLPGEIQETMRKGPISQKALELSQLATQRMGAPNAGKPSKPDDATFILYRGRSNNR